MKTLQGKIIEQIPISITQSLKGIHKTGAVSIVIPGTPIAKGRPRYTRQGHCYTPKKTLEAEQFVQLMAQTQIGGKQLSGSVAIELLAVCPVPASWAKKEQTAAKTGEIRPATKPDFDNLLKLYCDALNGLLWNDDKQIVDGRCIKCYGEKPAVIIWCWQVR